jgi:hypothetical protein
MYSNGRRGVNYRESLELRRLPRYNPPSLSPLSLSLLLSLSLSLDRSLSLPLSLDRDLVLDLDLDLFLPLPLLPPPPPPSLLLSLSLLLFLSPSLSLLSTVAALLLVLVVVGFELERDVLGFLALADEAGVMEEDCFSSSFLSWSFSPPNSVMYSTLLSTSGLVERELEPLLQKTNVIVGNVA